MDRFMAACYIGIILAFIVVMWLIFQNIVSPPAHIAIPVNLSMAQAYCANQTSTYVQGCTDYDSGKFCSNNESACVVAKQLCWASTNTPGYSGWNTTWIVGYCQIPDGSYGLFNGTNYSVNK